MTERSPRTDLGILPDEIEVVQDGYQGITLDMLLWRLRDKPDETIVEIIWAPYVQRSDGTWGAPRVELGRLREEWLIRGSFPHQAQTVVW